jgi:translation initiation factor IF-3
MTVPAALERARGYALDLVEVSPKAVPAVCRIMDFGKYKYEQTKRQQAARKKQVTTVLKEIKFRPKTDEHDYLFKLRHIRKFLEAKHKVKVVIFFRGREIIHKDRGIEILARVREGTADLGTAVNEPRLDGRIMVMMMAPK